MEPIVSHRIGLLPRFIAFFIDLVIISVILNLIGVSEQISQYLSKPGPDGLSLLEIMNALFANTTLAASIFSFYLFYWMLEAIIGASPGKLLLGLQIADQDGNEAIAAQLWQRYFLKSSHYFVMVLALLSSQEFLLQLSNFLVILLYGSYFFLFRSRQTLYDRLSKTAVFKKSAVKSVEPVKPKESQEENI